MTLYNEEVSEYIAKMQAKAEAFFAQAGKRDIEIYRIEQFEPIFQDPAAYGSFYDGDSYVVVHNGDKCYDIHYWHGKNATSDETGSAAALSVQLSNNLPRASRHHLELMGEETDLFCSYFKKGVFYLEGGVESGFKKVDPTVYETKLLWIKGTRYPRVFSVPVSASSLNEGDVFVLDMGMKIYYWAGKDCNTQEKVKALEIAVNIKNGDRLSKAQLFYPREQNGVCEEEFWAALGGKPDSIKPAKPDDPPKGTEEQLLAYSLFHVSDASGKLETTEVTERPLDKDKHLNSNDTFILELFDQVFVWQGLGASIQEKRMGMKIATDFIEQKGKPKNTKVSRIPEGCEDAHFKSFFNGFYPMSKMDVGKENGMDSSTHAKQDIEKLAAQQAQVAQLALEKLGSSFTKTIYVLEDDLRKPVKITDPEEENKFYAESTYVVDLIGQDHRYMICWMGPKLGGEQVSHTSSAMDELCGGVLTSEMTRFRVRKGHEDATFMQFFPKGFFILDEARVSLAEWNQKVALKGALFRIQAPYGQGCRAIEQNEFASKYLNSNDSFFAMMPGLQTAYLWNGSGSAEAEQNMGTSMFDAFHEKPEARLTFREGEEPEEFWQALGGKGDYSSIKALNFSPSFEPRLFHVSNSSGYTFMKEVAAFSQEDLLNNDVYILDAYSSVFIWIGNQSNKFEQKGAYAKAEKYIESVTDERDKEGVTIQEVLAGHEPFSFTVHFVQWEPEVAQKWLEADPMVALKALAAAGPAQEEQKQAGANFDGFLDPETNRFSYEELKGKFPPGVKGNAKELYLHDNEYEKVFGMTRQQLLTQKTWKITDLKKKAGLF